MVFSNGPMDENTKGSSTKARCTEQGNLLIILVESTKETGNKANL